MHGYTSAGLTAFTRTTYGTPDCTGAPVSTAAVLPSNASNACVDVEAGSYQTIAAVGSIGALDRSTAGYYRFLSQGACQAGNSDAASSLSARPVGGCDWAGGAGSVYCPDSTPLTAATSFMVVQYYAGKPCVGSPSNITFAQIGVCYPDSAGGAHMVTAASGSGGKTVFFNKSYLTPLCLGSAVSSVNMTLDTTMTCARNPDAADTEPLRSYLSVSQTSSLAVPAGFVAFVRYSSGVACESRTATGLASGVLVPAACAADADGVYGITTCALVATTPTYSPTPAPSSTSTLAVPTILQVSQTLSVDVTYIMANKAAFSAAYLAGVSAALGLAMSAVSDLEFAAATASTRRGLLAASSAASFTVTSARATAAVVTTALQSPSFVSTVRQIMTSNGFSVALGAAQYTLLAPSPSPTASPSVSSSPSPSPTSAPTLLTDGKVAAVTVFTLLGVLCIVLGSYYYCYRFCSCCQCCQPPVLFRHHQQQQPPSDIYGNVMAHTDESRPI